MSVNQIPYRESYLDSISFRARRDYYFDVKRFDDLEEEERSIHVDMEKYIEFSSIFKEFPVEQTYETDDIQILLDIIMFFSAVLESNLNKAKDSIFDDQIVSKILDVFTETEEIEIITACLIFIDNYTIPMNNIFDFIEDSVIEKLKHCVESSVTRISYLSGFALANLSSRSNFIAAIPFDDWNYIINDISSPKSLARILANLSTIPIIIQHYLSWMERMTSLAMTNAFDDSIVQYCIQGLYSLLAQPISKDYIDQIIHLISDDLITCISRFISAKTIGKYVFLIFKQLYILGVRTSAIDDILEQQKIINALVYEIDSDIHIASLELFDFLVINESWIPSFEVVDNVLNILEEGNFEEKSSALIFICDLIISNEQYKTLLANQNFCNALIELINNDNPYVALLFDCLRNLLFQNQEFRHEFCQNESFLELYNFIFDPTLREIGDLDEILDSIIALISDGMNDTYGKE